MSSRAEKYYFNLDLLCSTDIEILSLIKKKQEIPAAVSFAMSLDDLLNWGFVICRNNEVFLSERGKEILERWDAALKAH